MALLVAGVAVVGTLIALVTYEPYISIRYSIAHPNGEFVRMEESCPSDADRHYFTSRTSTGESVSVDLCLLAMSFGKDNARLIPYKIDEQGMLWGAANYSSEVSNYARKLKDRFKLSASEEEILKKKFRDSIARTGCQAFVTWQSG